VIRPNTPLLLLAAGVVLFAGLYALLRGAFVYVPAPDFKHEISLFVPHEARVGEWVPLRVARHIGPFVRVFRGNVPTGAAAIEVVPPAIQEQVAANVSWTVIPEKIAEFDLSRSRSDPWDRSVRFSKAGTFQIRALSRFVTDAESSTATIVVVER
jgi:hypothetical protein